MARQATTEFQETQRLLTLAVSPEAKGLKSALFVGFVDSFATRLLPYVKCGLDLEALSVIENGWILEANRALEDSAPRTWMASTRARLHLAIQMIQKELAAGRAHKLFIPSGEEIRRETKELAQCVIANWFAVLEHYKEETSKSVIGLTACGVPDHYIDRLFEGVDTAVVGYSTLMSLFGGFVTSQFPVNSVSPLAPGLFLARVGERDFYLTNEGALL